MMVFLYVHSALAAVQHSSPTSSPKTVYPLAAVRSWHRSIAPPLNITTGPFIARSGASLQQPRYSRHLSDDYNDFRKTAGKCSNLGYFNFNEGYYFDGLVAQLA